MLTMKDASVRCHCWLSAKLTVIIVDGIRLLRAGTVCVFVPIRWIDLETLHAAIPIPKTLLKMFPFACR